MQLFTSFLITLILATASADRVSTTPHLFYRDLSNPNATERVPFLQQVVGTFAVIEDIQEGTASLGKKRKSQRRSRSRKMQSRCMPEQPWSLALQWCISCPPFLISLIQCLWGSDTEPKQYHNPLRWCSVLHGRHPNVLLLWSDWRAENPRTAVR